MRLAHAGAVDAMLAAWPDILRDQRAALVEQVVTVTDKRQLAKLAALRVDSGAGAKLLADGMKGAAATAVQRMLGEALSQGVKISEGKVKVDTGRLAKVAAGRAALAGAYLAQQAGTKALQVVQASPGTDARDQGGLFLGGLSKTSPRDQLAPAL